ncbi:hypothetical protein LTR53_018406, partial [Teratosphaeriaceae sp. CCFEE 6253]
GSVQVLDLGAEGSGGERVFVGWGSSAAFSEFEVGGDLVCETHFAASALFWWERVKSYRAFKFLDWHATPAEWDPRAVIGGGEVAVSWNGATEVAFWELRGAVLREGEAVGGGGWRELDILAREGFETRFVLPPASEGVEGEGGGRFTHFRVAALDAERRVLRESNVVVLESGGWGGGEYVLLVAASAVLCVLGLVGAWLSRRRGWRAGDWRQLAQSAVDRTKYQKLW